MIAQVDVNPTTIRS